VCQTVAYAHSEGVVHRDLSPSNVMVGAFGEVQVMDWGFAKVLADDAATSGEHSTADDANRPAPVPNGATHSGTLMGTPAYMPPERAPAEAALVAPRADVFPRGAILCEVLTGKPPYSGKCGEEVCRRAAEGDQHEARARLKACPADAALRELAEWCLAVNRDDRPANADVVSHELSAYLASAQERLQQAQLERAAADARAQEAGAKVQAERRARRLTLALATAGVVLLIAASVGWWSRERVRQAETARVTVTDGMVEAALAEASENMSRNDWPGARAAATRARE